MQEVLAPGVTHLVMCTPGEAGAGWVGCGRGWLGCILGWVCAQGESVYELYELCFAIVTVPVLFLLLLGNRHLGNRPHMMECCMLGCWVQELTWRARRPQGCPRLALAC